MATAEASREDVGAAAELAAARAAVQGEALEEARAAAETAGQLGWEAAMREAGGFARSRRAAWPS